MHNFYLGIGLYTSLEAGRLAGISSLSISRWLKGYQSDENWIEPIWEPELDFDEKNQVQLTFRDLMEIRFINAFRKAGLPLQTVRALYKKASELIQDTRPFSTADFRTDGKTIFFETINQNRKDSDLLDLKNDQFNFKKFVEPTFKDIEYKKGLPVIWWPMENNKSIVLDPTRSFGQPIVDEVSIPTATLYNSYLANNRSIKHIAEYYEINPSYVKNALRFEKKLAGL